MYLFIIVTLSTPAPTLSIILVCKILQTRFVVFTIFFNHNSPFETWCLTWDNSYCAYVRLYTEPYLDWFGNVAVGPPCMLTRYVLGFCKLVRSPPKTTNAVAVLAPHWILRHVPGGHSAVLAGPTHSGWSVHESVVPDESTGTVRPLPATTLTGKTTHDAGRV